MTKPPKEPKTFKHPRLYWRDDGDKLRILYPDGTTDWYADFNGRWIFNTIKCDPIKESQAIKFWDRAFGYKTIFLGEIR